MKIMLIMLAAVAFVGCATTQSNVVCTGGSKDMTCHVHTAYQEPVGRKPVDVGR